jgi:hypothetical protein
MQDYVKLPGGAVCTAVEATEADVATLVPHYARVFIPVAARVRVAVEVGADKQVVFDGMVAPAPEKAGLLEIRLRRHVDVEAMPVEPKAEAERGM